MRTLTATLVCLLIAALAPSAWAQDYGVGETIVVPEAPGNIIIDGEIEPIWDTGAEVDLLASTSWWSDDFPQDINDAFAQLYYTNDTLYVHVFIDDTELFTDAPDGLWQSDQIFIGFDPVHIADSTDVLVDQDDWAGWPDNAPDAGPHAYRIYIGEEGGEITLNFDAAMAAEYSRGVVYTDEENQDWGFEAAFYVPGIEPGAEIGFNVGGAQANAEACDALGECAYGFFSRWSTENPGGDIYSRTDSYGTLAMESDDGGEGYGSGATMQVPQVDPGSIVIDGEADEAAWANAQTDIDITANWSSYGAIGDPLDEPDVFGETKLLWSEDTLYVHVHLYDVELFWGGDTGQWWNSDALFVGIDNTHEGDSLFAIVDGSVQYDGAPYNAPDEVYTYFINEPYGITLGFNEEYAPADSGWVNGVVFADEENVEWGFEAAYYVPNVELGAEIGFDIGGVQASVEQCEAEGECAYSYYAWQTGPGDPGAINRDASNWATLQLVEEVTSDIEETPGDGLARGFALSQNYPNPFQGSTRMSYTLPAPGHVRLAVYDVLGRQVATLVDGARAANSYSVEWQTEGLPGGLYFYRLEVDGSTVATRTMTVLK